MIEVFVHLYLILSVVKYILICIAKRGRRGYFDYNHNRFISRRRELLST
jgi:hypothetical protein